MELQKGRIRELRMQDLLQFGKNRKAEIDRKGNKNKLCDPA